MRIRWRGLELPNRLVGDRSTLTDTYDKFIAEPFERGFGVTVGNSLRRILLSSLEGSAVTRVKIQGVQHEISTIPGVVEDVTDIILNVKSLVVKNASEQARTIRIDRHERGVVTAASIITDEAVQIINPDTGQPFPGNKIPTSCAGIVGCALLTIAGSLAVRRSIPSNSRRRAVTRPGWGTRRRMARPRWAECWPRCWTTRLPHW